MQYLFAVQLGLVDRSLSQHSTDNRRVKNPKYVARGLVAEVGLPGTVSAYTSSGSISMVLNVGDIRGGMDVYALGGTHIGMVRDVLLSRSDEDTPDVGAPISVSLPPDTPLSDDPESAQIAATGASTSFFTVEGEGGVYHIPFSAVATFFPGQNVTLDCTEDECSARYREVPD